MFSFAHAAVFFYCVRRPGNDALAVLFADFVLTLSIVHCNWLHGASQFLFNREVVIQSFAGYFFIYLSQQDSKMSYRKGVDLGKENPGVGDSLHILAVAKLQVHSRSNIRNLRSGKGSPLAHGGERGRRVSDKNQKQVLVDVETVDTVCMNKESDYSGLCEEILGVNPESPEKIFVQSRESETDLRAPDSNAGFTDNYEQRSPGNLIRSVTETKSTPSNTNNVTGSFIGLPAEPGVKSNEIDKFGSVAEDAELRIVTSMPVESTLMAPSPTESVLFTMRCILQSCMEQLNFRSAIFWCDKLIALTQSNDDMLTKCKLLYHLREYRRCVGFIDRYALSKRHVRFRYFKALCSFETREFDSALKELDDCLKPDDCELKNAGGNDMNEGSRTVAVEPSSSNIALRSFISPSDSCNIEQQLTSSFLSAIGDTAGTDETSLNCRRAVNFDESTHSKPRSRPRLIVRSDQKIARGKKIAVTAGDIRASLRNSAVSSGSIFADTPLNSISINMFDDSTPVDASMMRFNAIRANTSTLSPHRNQKFTTNGRRSVFSDVYLLRGRIFLSLQNRALAMRSFGMSLLIDPTNYAAFDYLVHDISLSASESAKLLNDIESQREGWPHEDSIAYDVLIGLYRNIACASHVAGGGRCELELDEDRLRSYFSIQNFPKGQELHNNTNMMNLEPSPVIKTSFVPSVTAQPPPATFAVRSSAAVAKTLKSFSSSSTVDEQENVVPEDNILDSKSETSASKREQKRRRFRPYAVPQQQQFATQATSSMVDNFATPVAVQHPRLATGADDFANVRMRGSFRMLNTESLGFHALGLNPPSTGKETLVSSWIDKAVADCATMFRKLSEGSVELRAARAIRQFETGDFAGTTALTADLLFCEPYYLDIVPTHLGALVRLATADSYSSNSLTVKSDSEVNSKPVADIFQLAHSLVNIFPQQAISWYAVACFYYVTGKYDLARRFLLKSSALNPNMAELWILLGHSFAIEAEHDQATSAYFHAAHVLPSSHVPLRFIAKEYLRTNSLTLAAKFIDDALALNSCDPELLLDAALLVIRKHQQQQRQRGPAAVSSFADDAMDDLNDEQNVDQEKACVVTALAYLQQAEHYIHVNLDDRPKALLESVLYHTGYCEMKQKRWSDAIGHFERTRQIYSANLNTLKCLAWCYACERNKTKAMVYANQCAALMTNAAKFSNIYHPTSYYDSNARTTDDIQIPTIFAMIVEISASSLPFTIVTDGGRSSPTSSTVWSVDEKDDESETPAVTKTAALISAVDGSKQTGAKQRLPQVELL